MMTLLLMLLSHADEDRGLVDRILATAERGALESATKLTLRSGLAPVDKSQLLGYLALRRGDLKAAVALLTGVVSEVPTRSAAWLYLGIAFYRQGDPKRGLAALSHLRAPDVRPPHYYQLRARMERLTSSSTTAYATVDEGLTRFEQNPALLREQVSLLIEVGALTQAGLRAQELWRRSQDPVRERLWVARAYIDIGDFARAAALLEVVCAAAPGRLELTAQLAFVYAEQGHPRVAAELLDPRRLGSNLYAFESADQYRLAHATDEALRVNAHVDKPKRRNSQRLLILVEGDRLSQALALGRAVGEDGFDRVARYALAFALAHRGHPSAAQTIVDKLTPGSDLPGLHDLRAHLRTCASQPEACR